MNNCVLQNWVQQLTWKEQSALLTAIRGSDQTFDHNIRSLVRWVRRATLYDADVNGVFLKFGELPEQKALKKSLEYMTVHFVSHLMHALEIIGYKAEKMSERQIAFNYYELICEILHCNIETEEQMNERLKDNREEVFT